jgi:hypothetical protein
MSTVADPNTVSVAGVAPVRGQLRLLHPTRGYAVSRNPFAVWSILPLLALSFAGLAIAMIFISDATTAAIAVSAFLVVTVGLLLVPAVSLKGTINLTHDGIAFARGKHHLTAAWEDVVGLRFHRGGGLCLVIQGAEQTTARIRMPGGFVSTYDETVIPLRLFGDRQFSILYDLRDRLPEQRWHDAVARADRRSRTWIAVDYALVTAVCGVAICTVAYAITH